MSDVPSGGALEGGPGSDRRQLLLREGCAMLRYVGLPRRSLMAARHYARAVEIHQDGRAFDPEGWGMRWPSLLATSERRARRRHDEMLLWRFQVALSVADAVDGRSSGPGGVTGRVMAALDLARAGFLEALWRVLAPGLGRGGRE